MSLLRSLGGLAVVAVSLLLSIATSEPTAESECGSLLPGAADGEPCEVRGDCAEVCCFCEGSDRAFRANGCDLDNGVCYGGDALCQLALEEDPSLCEGDAPDEG